LLVPPELTESAGLIRTGSFWLAKRRLKLVVDSLNKSIGTESLIATSTSPPRVVRFGVFEVDLKAGEVRKAGLRQKLAGQPFQVLQALLDHPGEVVMREELRQRIWPENTFVDYELALKKAVNRLREVLGDSAESPRFIETVPRRGYRFIGSISGPSIPPKSGEQSPSVTQPFDSPKSTTHQRARSFLKLGLSLVLLATAGILIWSNAEKLRNRIFATSPTSEIHSVAVLPFKNLSNEPEQEYFVDGITDELIWPRFASCA
jgi:DNA-binding winged helix-turn-helix (wHTH) protein